MISISHSPNSNVEQQLSSLRWILSPWKWNSAAEPARLEDAISRMHADASSYSFSTGREALQAILSALNLQHGDEVVIQAFTCIVVPNSVLWAGGKPVYADIDASLNIDPASFEKRLTPKTKAVIVQHTFGIPAQMDSLLAIARKAGVIVIEDCAHALGATYKDQLVGTMGDAAIFSFGRDKVISSVSGGMAVINNQAIAKQVHATQSSAAMRPRTWILQQLLHPLLVPIFARLMHPTFPIGQILLKTAQSLKLVGKVYRHGECSAQPPVRRFYKLPAPQADLAYKQLHYLSQWREHRESLAHIYESLSQKTGLVAQAVTKDTKPVFLRWTFFTQNRISLAKKLREKGYLIGNWYNQVIMPLQGELSLVEYKPGSCPKAEIAAAEAVNLPTHYKISEPKAKEIAAIVENFYESK